MSRQTAIRREQHDTVIASSKLCLPSSVFRPLSFIFQCSPLLVANKGAESKQEPEELGSQLCILQQQAPGASWAKTNVSCPRERKGQRQQRHAQPDRLQAEQAQQLQVHLWCWRWETREPECAPGLSFCLAWNMASTRSRTTRTRTRKWTTDNKVDKKAEGARVQKNTRVGRVLMQKGKS